MMPTYGFIQEELDSVLDMVVCCIESMQLSLCKMSQSPWWIFLSCNMLAWYEQRSFELLQGIPIVHWCWRQLSSRHSVALANTGPLMRPTLAIKLIHTLLDLFVFESTYYLFFLFSAFYCNCYTVSQVSCIICCVMCSATFSAGLLQSTHIDSRLP
jgi:hypothetical protein